MPPRIRGKGRGPMRGGPSGHALSLSHSSEHHNLGHYGYSSNYSSSQPARQSVSHNSSPSHSHHSYHSHHSHQSHHSHSHSLHGSFDPSQYINTPPAAQNQLDQPNEPDEDSDPEMQPSGSHMHPIEIPSGSTSYAGSPYQGPNEWDPYWNQFTFVNTPSYRSPTQPPPPQQEDVQMELVEQPQPPLEPPRRKHGTRMYVSSRLRSSLLPPLPQTYPPIPEDPQMGGPSSTAPVVDPTPATFVQPTPSGFDNSIPTYLDMTGYDPLNPTTPIDYNYQAPSYDPYMQAVVHNALYPSSFLPHIQLLDIQIMNTSILLCLSHNHCH
ncbi:protein transport protein SEC31-like [Helianthus annuus]|uniref:protein transport protein SEC31-like n=1 Tax=Helianthus annuus TaxID=4232 RepID=UPI000B8F75E7|nr:protein transport protein SEC31-like [Helianthus annuus]